MRIASLILLVIGSLSLAVSAQTDAKANSTSPSTAPAPQMIRDKYQSIRVEKFEVKQGVEFPAEYLDKAQEEMFKQLADAKIAKEILRAGEQNAEAATPFISLSGMINSYTPGSRSKRYVGFGLGAAEIDTQIFLLDGKTKQRLQTERLRALLTGGVFGGSEDKIANELARRVVLQTRYMLNSRVPPTGSSAAIPEGASSTAQDRHTLTMNAKEWEEGQNKLEQEAAAGYRVVDFTMTGKSTANLQLEKGADPSEVFQYRWVHIRMYTHLQKELNKGTADGFHVYPQTLTTLLPYLTVLMEKPPGSSSVQYHYLVTEPLTMSNVQKDAEKHQREGYALLDETDFAAHILLFEKTEESGGK
jgi:Domain of unknown function (DUF4410)